MVGIIGGTGFYNAGLFGEGEKLTVETPYGQVEMLCGQYAGTPVYFLPRHGFSHGRLAFEITHHANIAAFQQLGVERILATTACGGIDPAYKGGDLVLLDQFVSWHTRHYTFGKLSLDMTEPYCAELRGILRQQAESLDIPIHGSGTFFSFDGPRYETAAEVRLFAQLGASVVGMTSAPEATLAREAGICYAAVAIVTNRAAGLSGDEPDLKAHAAAVKQISGKLQDLLCAAIAHLPEQRGCRCLEWHRRATAARGMTAPALAVP